VISRTARRTGALIAVLAVVVTLAGFAGYPVFVTPRTDPVPSGEPADAVIALGGMPESGASAVALYTEGKARHLVLSNPYGRAHNVVTRTCAEAARGHAEMAGVGTGGPRVTCFDPSPSTTRGEAREIARLAQDNGWRRVIVIAPTFHISRARMIIERCYSDGLAMVDAQAPIPAPLWVFEYGYQSAGYLKAFAQDGC
jgi:uncharacterized SAM-binding protein YcdF (DUF218 family)